MKHRPPALPIFIAEAPELQRQGDCVHVTGHIDGVRYHRVVPLTVLHIAVDRALALLTGPDEPGKVTRIKRRK